MHSLLGLTPTAASAHLSVLLLPDSNMIYNSFTLQGNRHTLYSCAGAHRAQATIRLCKCKLHVQSFQSQCFANCCILSKGLYMNFIWPHIEIRNVFLIRMKSLNRLGWFMGFSQLDFSFVWMQSCQVSSIHN